MNASVSVLIAARNEENTILDCLAAISRLTYPPDRLEVLIGDDHSEDRTTQFVTAYIRDKPNFHLIPVLHSSGTARGKAGVLAQLARYASGDFLFFTDADVRVPPDWIQGMRRAWQPGVGIVTGVTLVDGTTLFHRLQAVDWIYALGMIKTVSDLGLPVTAAGNNMMVTREAYEATGGYAELPFSITEDYALFRQIVQHGFGFRNILSPEVLAFTQPIPTVRQWLHQRKRWMHGAMQLPWYMLLILFLQALFFPVLLLSIVFFPVPVLLVWIVKIGLQSWFIGRLLRKLKQPARIRYLLVYELYNVVFYNLLIVFYFLPIPVEWKGRTYRQGKPV